MMQSEIHYLYLLLNYLILGWFLFVISFYRNLKHTKNYYHRSDLFRFRSVFYRQFKILFGKMPFSIGILYFLVASLLGSWLPAWGNDFGPGFGFFNSCIPFLLLYFLIPSIFALEIKASITPPDELAEPFENDKTDSDEGPAQKVRNLFGAHYKVLIAGFGLGYSAYLFFNWGTYWKNSFFWSAGNALVILWFTYKSMSGWVDEREKESFDKEKQIIPEPNKKKGFLGFFRDSKAKNEKKTGNQDPTNDQETNATSKQPANDNIQSNQNDQNQLDKPLLDSSLESSSNSSLKNYHNPSDQQKPPRENDIPAALDKKKKKGFFGKKT